MFLFFLGGWILVGEKVKSQLFFLGGFVSFCYCKDG